MLSPIDEFAHEPPSPLPAGWQENWYLLGWDLERSAGFSLHLGRIPGEERLAAKACVLAGGEVAVASTPDETPAAPLEVAVTVAAHAHFPYPEWADGFWLNDAFCSAEWNGRRGFGIVELNRIDR